MTSTAFVDYYELLEVEPTASAAEIKAAYRARMVRDHADQNPDDDEAKERMILLTRAKQTLLDEQKRVYFDRHRDAVFTARRLGFEPNRWTGGRAPDDAFERRIEVDLRDVSVGRLLVGVGLAAVVTGLGFAAKVVADRASKKRRGFF